MLEKKESCELDDQIICMIWKMKRRSCHSLSHLALWKKHHFSGQTGFLIKSHLCRSDNTFSSLAVFENKVYRWRSFPFGLLKGSLYWDLCVQTWTRVRLLAQALQVFWTLERIQRKAIKLLKSKWSNKDQETR